MFNSKTLLFRKAWQTAWEALAFGLKGEKEKGTLPRALKVKAASSCSPGSRHPPFRGKPRSELPP
ncbi:MAG: hypothetical protein KatS3mg007_0147 [Thermoanaerobaculum sp.]|jgi:hypothetical protein|nr:MAG: hypothetical protein KatS3mg007_0147 [Thermoanaerobaculum sp.]